MSKPDFLTVDTPIPGQEWIVISFIDGKRLKNCKQDFPIMKFRGAFATQDEAGKHASYLQTTDPFCNIYVGPGFTWIPAEDDPEKAKEGKYAEPEMNNLMEKYLMNQAKAKELYERRKNEMVMEAVTKNMKKKNKKNKHKSASNTNPVDVDDLVSKPTATKEESSNDLVNEIVIDTELDKDNKSSLEEVLLESKTKSATLDAEIARAKQLLGMDLDGFNKAKKAHDDMESKLMSVSNKEE